MNSLYQIGSRQIILHRSSLASLQIFIHLFNRLAFLPGLPTISLSSNKVSTGITHHVDILYTFGFLIPFIIFPHQISGLSIHLERIYIVSLTYIIVSISDSGIQCKVITVRRIKLNTCIKTLRCIKSEYTFFAGSRFPKSSVTILREHIIRRFFQHLLRISCGLPILSGIQFQLSQQIINRSLRQPAVLIRIILNRSSFRQ